VDDDLAILSLYLDELSDEGYEVIAAKDGKEALRQTIPFAGTMIAKERSVYG